MSAGYLEKILIFLWPVCQKLFERANLCIYADTYTNFRLNFVSPFLASI